MSYKETFWMACDSTEQLRAEYGPFHTRTEAECEARRLGFDYLLRYEHLLDEYEEIQEVRCIFIELPKPGGRKSLPPACIPAAPLVASLPVMTHRGRQKSGPTSMSLNIPGIWFASSNTPAEKVSRKLPAGADSAQHYSYSLSSGG